ncbi:MAG: hypothetical protein ABI595_12855 [Actinomycetota bacterium]
MAEFKPRDLLQVLDRHQVRYVLVGGLAAVLYGAPHMTTDLDIVPEDGQRNLERLSRALEEIDARIRVTGAVNGIAFDRSADFLRRIRIWNLTTDRGDLDITFEPSGTQGYDDLRRNVEVMTVGGVDVPVASLADVIRSKEAADRPRDRAILPVLREMLSHRTRPAGPDRSG